MTDDTTDRDEFDSDLADRFTRFGRTDAPDTWVRAVARSLEPEVAVPSRRRWFAIAAAVALVAVGVAGVAIGRSSVNETSVADTVALPATPAAPETASPDNAEGPRAVVEPLRAAPGESVTITPSAPVQPTCGDVAALYDLQLGSPVRLGVLTTDGTWVPESTPPTFRACLPAMSGEPITYTIPDEAPAGQVALCRSVEFTLDGCGRLIVLLPADPAQGADTESSSVAVPVVEGLTEGEAVTALRDLGFIVSVERLVVVAGDPNDGRVVTQSPAAAKAVDSGSKVRIVVGQASVAAGDELTDSLVGSGIDLPAAPMSPRSSRRTAPRRVRVGDTHRKR